MQVNCTEPCDYTPPPGRGLTEFWYVMKTVYTCTRDRKQLLQALYSSTEWNVY